MQHCQEPAKDPRKIPIAFIGAGLLIVIAAVLLWTKNAQTMQASFSRNLTIRFDGEYRITDGSWQPIVTGKHISSTKGDVTLRGNFSLTDPYTGAYICAAGRGTQIALYLNHIGCTISEPGQQIYTSDAENPLYGSDACGLIWIGYELRGTEDSPITMILHNPHRFGNENAIDDFLDSLSTYGGGVFEKEMENQGKPERILGLIFTLSAFSTLGIALFSSLLHIRQSRSFWQLGLVSFSGGGYFVLSAPNVFFWNWSTVSNTTILGLCMMLYMLFITWAATTLLGDKTRRISQFATAVSGVLCAGLFLTPVVSGIKFYDTWLLWAGIQSVVCLMITGCLICDSGNGKKKQWFLCISGILPMTAFLLDFLATFFGWWQDGLVSKYVFVLLYAGALVHVLRIIPQNIIAAAKAKELEAALQESRTAIMMSQIRPHFIFNTLGSIEQLCILQPEAAASLVHNFARYLRGNFGELDNHAPIPISQELEHVRCYVSIEKMRFPDITVTFDIQSTDFLLPALSVQPLVENAIKHGLMKLPEGGTVTVSTFETDTHYCVRVQDNGGGFDTNLLREDPSHIGLRNIRGRLDAMCGGTLTVESTPGLGTKVTILIPKEGL